MPSNASETATAPPLIIISYSNAQETWKEQLVSLFPTNVELVSIKVEDTLGKIDPTTKSLLNEAKVLVLLISPDYLGASWISSSNEGDYISQFEKPAGALTVIPVLIQQCPWAQTPFLQKYAVSAASKTGKAIAEAASDLQPRSLKAVVARVLDAAGLFQSEVPAASYNALTVTAETWDLKTEFGYLYISMEIRKILGRAWGYVLSSDIGAAEINSEILLIAMSEHGKYNPTPQKTPQFLWKELTRVRQGVKAYDSLLKDKFPGVERLKDGSWDYHEMRPATPNTLSILEYASQLSQQTYKPRRPAFSPYGRIGGRHLLAAMLTFVSPEGPSGALQALSQITNVDVLRNRLFDFVKSIPDDDPEAWRKILVVETKTTNESKPRAATKSASKTIDENLIPATNNVSEQDVVVEGNTPGPVETPSTPVPEPAVKEAAASATPITSSEATGDTSAAVGAPTVGQTAVEDDGAVKEEFGGEDKEASDLKPILAGFATDYWEGKDLLNTTNDVNALASLVSAWSVEPPLSIGLFGDWGSGKSHFMRQMRQRVEKLSRQARKSARKQNEIGYYKNIVQIEFNAWHYIEGNLWASLVDHIFANLKVSDKEEPKVAEARRDELMQKLGVKLEIEAKLKSKAEEHKNQLTAKRIEVTNLVTQAETGKKTAADALVGFRNEAEAQLNELPVAIQFSADDQALLERFGIKPSKLQTAGAVRRQYQDAKKFSNKVVAQWKLFWTDPRVGRRWIFAALLVLISVAGVWLTRLPQVKGLPAGLASVLAFIATLYGAAKPAWDQFRKGLKALEQQDEEIERERQKRIAELQAEVNALTKSALDAQNQAQSIQAEISNLETQIRTTTTSKILAEFIEDRAAASDYRRHLGLLALIRRDFEKLRELFKQQRMEEKHGKETTDLNRINRIILYIDDLDRCPPQRVVEVLQAIHLLLAFPIFVVVVGVDARWVTRSLQESYEWLRFEDEDDKKEHTDADSDEHVEGATPHDYLEKIFQIPFWLRQMEETQTQTFIEGLTEQIRYKHPEQTGASNGSSNGNNEASNEDLSVKPELRTQAMAAGNGHPVEESLQINDEPRMESPKSVEDNFSEQASASTIPDNDALPVDRSKTIDDAKHDDEIQAAEPIPTGDAQPIDMEAVETKAHGNESDVRDQEVDTHVETEDEEKDEELIDLAPGSLTLGDQEIEYMKSLAKLIGRSPRAVKRFLNCYRLIKVSLPPAKLDKFVQDGKSYEYKAVMVLLGIVTGAPTAALYVMEETENWKWEKDNRPTMSDFYNRIERNEDLLRQPDWPRLRAFLTTSRKAEDSAKLFEAFMRNAPRVSRYSFRVARAEVAGPRRVASPKKVAGRVAPTI